MQNWYKDGLTEKLWSIRCEKPETYGWDTLLQSDLLLEAISAFWPVGKQEN